MPQIWRARLTNIEYDSGKKIYADELFRFNSQNTLINLANGGGKTLLIQLLLQVVMPNEMLNKRPLADLLGSKKYTGHILVEWKLDNPEPTYLTTGFCFTRGNDEGDRLKYFLYTLHYRQPNEFDIKNLPLVQEKTPLDYAELLALLRGARNQDSRVTIFDRDDKRRAYLAHLSSYNIFEKEWKNIKVTNNVEGGVGEFFAAAKTSKQLLETVLIPAVEEAIFAGEEDAKRLSQAFAQVHQNLIRLPELQKNLHDFQVLRTEGERVLEAVRSFEESQGKLICEKDRLRNLYNSADRDMNQIKQDLAKIEEQLTVWKTQRIELNYHAESIPYVRLQQQKELAAHGKWEAEERLNSATEKYANADFVWRQSRGYNDYLERAELLGSNAALKKRRELASLGQEEQLTELDLARVTFRAILERLCSDLEKDYTQSSEANSAMDKRLREVSVELTALRQTDKELAMKVAGIETTLRTYQTKWDELYQVYQNMAWLEDPALALRELKAMLTSLRGEIKALEERRLSLIEEQKTRAQRIQDLAVRVSENQTTLKAYKLDKQQAEAALLELQEFLGRYSIRCVAPYTEQSRIKAEISAKKMEFQDKIRFEGVRLEQLKDQLSLIRESGAYVPNREILKVQRLMEELQIPVQLGSKWLEEQGVSEQERLGYVRHNPLLPYALVLAEEDFKRLQNNKSFSTGVLSCPVPLLVRRPELVPPTEITTEKLMSVNGAPAYLLWHKGYDYALSPESLESVVTELEAELERATRNLQTLVVSEEQLRKLGELESSFFSRYPTDYLTTIEKRLWDVLEQLKLDLGEKERLETEKAQADLEFEEMRLITEERKNAEHLRGKDVEKFSEWQKEALAHTRQLAEHKGLREEQTEITRRLLQGVAEEGALTRERLAGASKLKEVEGLRNVRRDELREVPLPNRQDLTPRDVPYEDAKGCWRESENAVAEVHSEVKYCDENIQRNQREIERLERRIERDLKLSLAEVEEAKYKTSEEELDRLEAESHVWNKEIESRRKTVNSKGLEVEGLLGQLTEKEAQIKKTYGRIPETGFKDLNLALAKLEKERHSLQRQEQEWTLIQKDTVEQERILVDGMKSLATSLNLFEVPPSEETLPQEEWQMIRAKLASTIENLTQELGRVQKLVQKLREAGEKSFRGYADILRRQGNSVVDRFVSHLLADEERRFQLEVMEQAFAKSFEMIAKFEEKASFELIEAEQNKQELVVLSINQAQRIAQEMQRIDRFVKVDYAGKRVNAVQIKLKDWEPDKAHALMNAYIDDLIKELKRLAELGEPEEKQEKFIDKKMSSRQLLNVLANLEQATIRVLKPEQHPTSPYFDPWDDVQKWSGGERYAGYMAMFMAILSYTRSKLSSLHNPYKVMLADNPFGAASSPHVLNLIFQLAESNNIQMICLTALTEDTIFTYFPAVYSLRLRPFMGKDYMTSKIERGFYQIDPLEEELRRKRQIEFEWE
jgi:hypothetical protein